jgi:hypothetical protein
MNIDDKLCSRGPCCVTLAALLACLLVAQCESKAQSPAINSRVPSAQQSISVADLLRFNTIGDPLVLNWNDDIGKPGIFSPDGSQVVVLVRGGDPQRETNNATLWLYVSATLMSDPKPIKLAEFAAANAYQPIAFVRWLADNETVVFAGTRGAERSQVFSVNTRTLALKQLTHAPEQFTWFDVAPSGSRLVTLFELATVPPGDDPQCKRYGCRVESVSLYEAEHGGNSRMTSGSIHTVLTGESKALISPESQDDSLNFCDPEFAGGLSPDGRYAIRLCRLKGQLLPAWWGDYTMKPLLQECMTNLNARCWRRGEVIDLATGKPLSWTDAPLPNASSAPPIWIDGGRHVIFPSAFESLTDVDAKERAHRAEAYAVQIMDPTTRKTLNIGRLDPKLDHTTGARWDEKTQTLMIEGVDSKRVAMPTAYFRRSGEQWTTLKAPAATSVNDIGVKLSVEQSLNDRPMLVGVDERTGRKRKILDPNPWLAERKLGRVEAISWDTKTGQRWRGGLYYPSDYQSGQRLPLVLQTHGFEAEQFSLNGWAKDYPGQALSTHGIFVLQLNEYDGDTFYTTKYWDYNRAIYEGAIDYLDELGLIDRNRVGTIGFSNSGNTTASMLTHSDYPIAAAAFGDTAADGFWFYLQGGGSQKKEPHFGSQPFGSGIAPWLELSPTFNLTRVRTPLLMFDAESPSGMWDFYAGLRSLGSPVEFWNLPTGTHDIYQASQRIRMNQLIVDWFRFWLKGEERGDSGAYKGETAQTLAEQYARWREFRKRQEVILRQPRPPLLSWTSTSMSDVKAD